MANRFATATAVATVFFTTALTLGFGAQPGVQTPPSQSPPAGESSPAAGGNKCSKAQHAIRLQHAYHNDPPTAPLPATLDPAQFTDNKAAFVAYSIAAKIREVLYQEPCYCPCDKSEGHQSLLDCYAGHHGKVCRGCQMEVIFVFEQWKAGKTPAAIREAMENGEVWKLDLNKYVETHYSDYERPKLGE